MKRRLLSVFLLMALLCSMLSLTALTVSAEEDPAEEVILPEEAAPAEEPTEETSEAETPADRHTGGMAVKPEALFNDVSVKDWYYTAVLWAINNSITSGTAAKTFSPDKTCTRAEVVTFLWNAAGRPEVEDNEHFAVQAGSFADVHFYDWFRKAVNWAVANGITKGTDATHFSPDKVCTRAEIVTFIWNAAGRPTVSSAKNQFTDVSKTDWCFKAVMWAAARGITKGTTTTTFSPANTCTRAEAVQFLYNARWYWIQLQIPKEEY